MKDIRPKSSSRRQFILKAGSLAASLAVAPGLLAACGDATTTPTNATTAASGATSATTAAATTAAAGTSATTAAAASNVSGTVTFWDMAWGGNDYIDNAKKLVDQFNKDNPNIKVTYQSTPWTNWYQTFSTAIASNSAPDISTGAGYQAVQFYDQGAILDVDDVVADLKSNGKLDDFSSGAIDRLKYKDHYVALPWAIDTRVMFYRKDLFEKAGITQLPTNWDELKATAKKLTTGNQYALVAGTEDLSGSFWLLPFIFGNGGGLFNSDGKLDVMNDRNIEAITYLADLVKAGYFNPGSAGFKSDDARKAFASGSAAIIMEGPSLPGQIPEAKANMGIIPPLTGPHGDKGTISWVNNIMIYKQSKNPAAAKVFLKWWSDNQKSLWTVGKFGQLPARTSIGTDPYFQNDPLTKLVQEKWIPVGKSTGNKMTTIAPVLNDIEGDGVMQTLFQDLLQGKDPKQSLQKAEARLKTIVK